MRSDTRASDEVSGVFWWWRAPNDSLRTGERSELESALTDGSVTPRCFVWRSDWSAWLQAAEVAQFREAVPPSLQMPLVDPALVEPTSEPPPLPALFDVLCEARSEPSSEMREDEITHTQIDFKPAFLKIDEDEITVPGVFVETEEATHQMLAAAPVSMPVSMPLSMPLAMPLSMPAERTLEMPSEPAPPPPRDWQERVLKSGIFVACAVSLCGLAAIAAVGLNRAFDASQPALVVTVAGPSQTRVPDASVFVDGEFRCVQAPCRVELSEGIHLVSVAAPGFAPAAARAVELKRDKREQMLHFDLIQGSERVAAVAPTSQDP